MEDADQSPQNPFAALEGYVVVDAYGAEAGEVDGTVYDAGSNVLKYLSVNGHAVLTDRIEVNPEAGQVRIPYAAETVRSAPSLEDPSGEFDRALRAHYGEDG